MPSLQWDYFYYTIMAGGVYEKKSLAQFPRTVV